MSIKKVNIDTCNHRDDFIVLRNVHVHYLTVQDHNRNKISVELIAEMVFVYVPRSTDMIK
jgi:hypothetical protein